jgi:hypothetical protein
MLVIAAPSYAVNVFVAKPMTVAATSFFFFHITDVLSLPNTSTLRIGMSDIYHKDFSLLK